MSERQEDAKQSDGESPATYMARRFFEATKRALDDEMVRLKGDPVLAGASMFLRDFPLTILYSLLLLVGDYAAVVIDTDCSGGKQMGKPVNSERIRQRILDHAARIMHDEWKKRGVRGDLSWPGSHEGHA